MADSVRTRLTLWYTCVLALVLILFSTAVYTQVAHKLAARLDTHLRNEVDGVTRLFVHEKDEEETDLHSARSALRKSYFPHEAAAFFDAQGELLAETPLRESIHSRLPDGFFSSEVDGIQFFTLSEGQTDVPDGLRVAAYRITAPSMNAPSFIVISEPLTDLAAELNLLRGIFYIAVPTALALAGFGGWFLARKSLAPVVVMSESARRISAENLQERLPVANPRDELGQLATTFNELLDRLYKSFEQQRQFMADASHELRTPLTVMRTASEVTLEQPHREESEYREALTIFREQTRQLGRLVEEMFTLARADAGQRMLEPRGFYLDELVAETVRAASVLGGSKNVAIELAPTRESPYLGDEKLLRQMILNLLDNAVKYTQSGGQVSVELAQENSHYLITVTDTGSGISAEAQPYIFERFYRADRSRGRAEKANGSGAGLGLSIAKWIAEAHEGSLSMQHSSNRGSTFVAVLPLRSA
jgi:two-component system, OmpR family, sensor kinase